MREVWGSKQTEKNNYVICILVISYTVISYISNLFSLSVPLVLLKKILFTNP